MPDEIPRGNANFSREHFNKILNIAVSNEWLRRKASALYDLWGICGDSQEKQELILELTERFHVMDHSEVEDACAAIRDQILDEWALPAAKTLVIAASDDSEADGSQAAIQSLKAQFGGIDRWSEQSFRNSMAGYDDYLRSGWNYVLIDDFVGTGSKAIRRYRAFGAAIAQRGLSDCKTFLVSFAGMNSARVLLEREGITYFCPMWMDKGIDGFNDSAAALKKRVLMRDIERSLMSRFQGQYLPSLGYKGSQSLFSIGGSTCPNNVFPIFWWPRYSDKSHRQTILRRVR